MGSKPSQYQVDHSVKKFITRQQYSTVLYSHIKQKDSLRGSVTDKPAFPLALLLIALIISVIIVFITESLRKAG